MAVENINGTEYRFKNPGRLLLVVIGFVFWGVGLLDLLGHTSADADLFGLYSLPFFILILLYASTIVIWFALFLNSNLLSRVAEGVRSIQNSCLMFGVFLGLGIAFWVIFEWDRWARLPGLQFAVFGLVVLAFLIFLFAYWGEGVSRQPWRRGIAYPLAALAVIEIIVQGAAWLGFLPGVLTIGGDFYPYERIYTTGEGHRDAFANRYGWNFTDEEWVGEKRRIVLVGGSYVQALPIPPEQQLSMLLTDRLNETEAGNVMQVQVVPIGMPGFGVSPFLYDQSMQELPYLLDTRELIVFFHLGDDFQSSSNNAIRYIRDSSNKIIVHPDDAWLRHDLTHYFLRSFLSLQLVETIRSNYLTPKVIQSWMHGGGADSVSVSAEAGDFDFPRSVATVSDTYDVTEPGHGGIKTTDLELIPHGNNFMFEAGGSEEAQQAIAIADSMFATAQEIGRSNNVTLRIVTVPVFPEGFYTSYRSGSWEPKLGEYDLFLPEKALIDIAQKHNIPILPMGQYMLEDGLTVDEISALYLPNDQGSLTPEGHRYYADAVYTCFFADPSNSVCVE